MRYLLLIYLEPGYLSPGDEVARAMNEEYRSYSGWLSESGMLLGGEALQASRPRPRSGARRRRIVTDGPFAETKEHLGGYYLIEADDLDEAIDSPPDPGGARIGSVEVRPI